MRTGAAIRRCRPALLGLLLVLASPCAAQPLDAGRASAALLEAPEDGAGPWLPFHVDVADLIGRAHPPGPGG
nr:hypothetical protein [bacterium]